MEIRRLSPTRDREAVAAFFAIAADYVTLETGAGPDDGTVTTFFDERPPCLGPEAAVHLGLYKGETLCGLLGMTFGYPTPTDAYIGLLLLAPDARGAGVGRSALAHATEIAQARGAARLFVAVLDANPKGRAFWIREGFMLDKIFAPTDDGHIRHRLVRAI